MNCLGYVIFIAVIERIIEGKRICWNSVMENNLVKWLLLDWMKSKGIVCAYIKDKLR